MRCAATTERGDDIVARRGADPDLFVEAKGETSNRVGSKRYGKAFDGSQCRDHVANALYSAAAYVGMGQPAIALPDTHRHRACVNKINRAIDALGTWVFWVAGDRSANCNGRVSRSQGTKAR